MENEAFCRLVKLISSKTGLRLDGQDGGTLRKITAARMSFHGFTSFEQYADMLEDGTAKGLLECEELISLLTVGESYFFRDKGQFDLLRNIIMPELIERRQAGRTLNIWSAGCSTGEEPYSLAILLYESIPNIAEWRVQIMGTDIKEEFLQKARKAVYGEWSFRMVPDEIREKYFKKKGGKFELDPIIKNMVAFRRGNLLGGVLPSSAVDTRGMDLILCRNVFIYYRRKTAAEIVEKMAESLLEGGFLITGHWEFFSPPSGMLTPRMFPGSLAYQRVTGTPGKAQAPPPPRFPAMPILVSADIIPGASSAVPDTQREPKNVLAEAEVLFKDGAYRQAAALLEKELRKTPDDFRALCLAASAHANLGEHGRAVKCLHKAIAVNPLLAEPYLLLARIAEESGDTDAAREYLGKVIYLEPGSIAAYLDLAAIHDNAGEMEKARKMRMAALDVLKKLPEESTVEPYGMRIAELKHHIELLLLG